MGPVKDDCQICLQHGGGGSGVGDIIGNFTNMVSYQWKPNGGHQAWTLINKQLKTKQETSLKNPITIVFNFQVPCLVSTKLVN